MMQRKKGEGKQESMDIAALNANLKHPEEEPGKAMEAVPDLD